MTVRPLFWSNFLATRPPPDAGHKRELEGRKRDLEDALKRVVTHCGKYAGAAAAIAAATRALIAVLPYLEFAGEVVIVAA